MDNNNGQRFEYDIQKRAQAGMKATFRAVVSVYIIYLGYKLFREAVSAWQIAAGVFFIVVALLFGGFTYRRWRLDLEAARLPDGNDPAADRADEDTNEPGDTDDADEPGDEAGPDEDMDEDESYG